MPLQPTFFTSRLFQPLFVLIVLSSYGSIAWAQNGRGNRTPSTSAAPAPGSHPTTSAPAPAPIPAPEPTGSPPVCACPSPPRAETSFTLTFNRGTHGTEIPEEDFSESTTVVNPVRTPRSREYQITSYARFFSTDGLFAQLTCTVRVAGDRSTALGGMCSMTVVLPEGGSFIAEAAVPTATIVELEDTVVEYALPPLTFAIPSTGGSMSAANISFRASDPNAHFITPSRAFRRFAR
jgi:hypothetical protein